MPTRKVIAAQVAADRAELTAVVREREALVVRLNELTLLERTIHGAVQANEKWLAESPRES